MTLTPNTVLQRVPELLLEIDSANELRVHHDRRVLLFGHHAISLLDVFQEPLSVGQAMRRIAPRLSGERAVNEALSTVTTLVSAGVLQQPQQQQPAFTDLVFPSGGYGLASLNIAILDDPVRKACFIQAIEEVVTPDDVVLDLGTGSGILAIAAARAGARHVYAVEPARSGDLAAKVAQANGLAERITFIRGWSTSTNLPERATVLTTDIVGNEAFDMMIWETLQDARERLLTPDARLIPSAFTAYLYLVDIPVDDIERHRIMPSHIERWKGLYAIDFSPMLDAENRRVAGFYDRPEIMRTWPARSSPVTVFHTNLHDRARRFESSVDVIPDGDGTANGVILYFDATLSAGTTLSTAPWEGNKKSHWFTAGWAFAQPISLTAGTPVRLTYCYEGDGRAQVRSASQTDASHWAALQTSTSGS